MDMFGELRRIPSHVYKIIIKSGITNWNNGHDFPHTKALKDHQVKPIIASTSLAVHCLLGIK